MELSIFSLSELDELYQNALNTLRLLKSQVADIPKASIPAINLIQIDEMEKRVAMYQSEIDNRISLDTGTKSDNDDLDKMTIIKRLIQSGHTFEALDIIIQTQIALSDKTIQAEALLLSNRWALAQSHYLRGGISRADHLIEINQINLALIEIMNKLS